MSLSVPQAQSGQLEMMKWLVAGVGFPSGSLHRLHFNPAAYSSTLKPTLCRWLSQAQNGQLEMMKWLVDELGQDLHMRSAPRTQPLALAWLDLTGLHAVRPPARKP